MTILLDDEFLRSLGIKEDFLPRQSPPTRIGRPKMPRPSRTCLLAEGKPVPPEVLNLSPEELEKLLKEQHSQENPHVNLMPGGSHTVAVYPIETKAPLEKINKNDLW